MDGNPELGLSYTDIYGFIDDPSKCFKHSLLRSSSKISGKAFDQLYGNGVIPNSTVMIRKSVVEVIGFLDEAPTLKSAEDYEYWLRISRFFSIGYIDKPLAKYRQHPEGISKSIIQHNQAILYIADELDRQFPDIPIKLAKQRQQWRARLNYGIGRALLRQNEPQAARKYFRSAWKSEKSALLFWIASFLGEYVYSQIDGLKQKVLS